jgi:type IV pilus assembly protein PilM
MNLQVNFRQLLRGRLSPIGLDIGSRQIKAVQLARAGDGWRVRAAACIPRASGGEFALDEATRLADVLHRQAFEGSRVVVSAAPERLMSSMLELPPAGSGVPLEQIARMELARVHQRDAGSFEFAQWQVPHPARATKSNHVMAVACAHDAALGLLDALEGAGLSVEALDHHFAALARPCRPLIAAAGTGLCAMLDLGAAAARLAILHQGIIIYSRVIEDGGLSRLCAELVQQLGIEPAAVEHLLAEPLLAVADAKEPRAAAPTPSAHEPRTLVATHFNKIVQGLNVSFEYAAHQYPDVAVQRVLLSGGGAEMPGLSAYLGETLRAVVQVARPSELVAPGADDARCSSPAMVAATGLALYDEDGEGVE